ncbi:MAG TPA: hypothetical protein PLG90_05845 [Ignavibacteria bacterium]|nr:hypothetical protein [Ignavibacteria bacterium]
MEKSQLVIAAFKVKPDKIEELKLLINEKRIFLLDNGYVTDRPNIVCQSSVDKSIVIEIFEWVSNSKIDEVHNDERIYKYWNKFVEICDLVGLPLEEIPESKIPFGTFHTLN